MPSDSLLRTHALTRHNTLLLLRDPGPLISRLVPPLIFATLMRPLYQAAQGAEEGATQAVISALVTFSLLAMSIVGGSIITERVWHTWQRLAATTAHPVEIIIGKALPIMATLLIQEAAILAFGVLVLGMPPTNLVLCTVALLSWTLTLLALGSAVGVFARSFGELAAAYDIGGIILSTVGGALVPLSTMPGWVNAIAPFSPGYWATVSIKASVAGDASRALSASAALLAFTFVFALLAAFRLTRGWQRSDKF